MPFDMGSKTTLMGLAVLYGLCKAMGVFVEGAQLMAVVVQFLGATIIGTLITMGLVWIVLAIVGKGHLHTKVTSWVMLLGVCLSILNTTLLLS